ncbi:YhcN/YlaJ family sporulation lipoprotein [Niallia circulans]|uniref:YhcN/YlaJ family sporulation lipoprotein n=1 Tax=Niallia circulans TaxID=1397 RepID=A0A941G9A4_NIACI|nr:YhcN/YlaJ family sporulation lipoprotein [Niallia circulans]MCB5235656.1 YhcN/YlaJ family sporulation lipoprotein [Niallia circulans]
MARLYSYDSPLTVEDKREQSFALDLNKGENTVRKNKLVAPVLLTLTFGLTGCGVNEDQTADQNRVNNARPIGYYSNEQHEVNNGNRYTTDNDGPITEIMDHTYGDEGYRNDVDVRNVNNRNNVNVRNVNDRNVNRDNINRNDRDERVSYDTKLAQKVSNTVVKIDNVKNARSIVYGDNVLVALEVENTKNVDKTKANVKDKLNDSLNGRDISVVTDRGIFTSIEDINRSIRNGQPQQTITNNIENIFRDLNPTRDNR